MTRYTRLALVIYLASCSSGGAGGGAGGDGGDGGGSGGAAAGRGGRGGSAGSGGSAGGASGGTGGTGGAAAGSGGAPARDGGVADAPTPGDGPALPPTSMVLITEIMYHPVLEDSIEEAHEFVEIHNRGAAAVRLGGWRLGGDVAFTFPDSATIQPGQYLVVAKNRTMLAAVAKYNLGSATVLGDYQKELGNGGRNSVTLLDGAGTVMDAVPYQATFPWPIGADGFGLQPSWWPASLLPAEGHRHMGRSLERIALDVASALVENWDASPIDGATPGRANASAGTPKAVAVAISALASADGRPLIRPADRVAVQVKFSERGTVSDVVLEYFVDDVARADERYTPVPMAASADGYRAELPPHPANSIVRYRVLGKRGGAMAEVISPRPSDPYATHAYFVNPDRPGRTRAYHLFVAPVSWGTLWTNNQPGWVMGCGVGQNPACTSCAVNARWDAYVPGVFVSEGRVFDARVRYQGGKFSRLTGRPIAGWTSPPPSPSSAWNMQALGWRVQFPRYKRLEGKKAIRLNKRAQACTGIPDGVMSKVFETVGVPAPQMRYARLYLNGGYYLYALEQESMDESWLERALPTDTTGDLYNDNSIRWDQGPWGWGDFRILQPFCNYNPTQRYAYTYERKTLEWKDNSDQISLLMGLHTARAAGDAALRTYLDQNFHRDLVLKYLAVINWAGAWDDDYHNYYLYRRASDGKWMLMSSDNNNLLTGWTRDPVTSVVTWANFTKSFYIGREGEPPDSNTNSRWNFIKDSFFRAFKPEYDAIVKTLGAAQLSPAAVDKLVDEMATDFDMADARASLSYQASCDDKMAGPTGVTAVKTYIRERHKVLLQRFGM